jgi:hypothetical protein
MHGNQEKQEYRQLGNPAATRWVAAISLSNPDQNLLGGRSNVQGFSERQSA